MSTLSTRERTVDLRILSLGAGVQSTTMYLMACEGEIGPLPDYAIFADTQQEPPWVYENLDRLEGREIPIVRATAGDLGAAVEGGVNSTGGRFAAVPFWIRNEDGSRGAGRRQCTREYKIDVIRKTVRELLGLKPRQRAKGRVLVEEWVGISLDEAHRVKPSRHDWIRSRWPLVFDRPTTRWECEEWLRRHDYPVPGKSACVFCPYRSPLEYARWRDEHPELFEQACQTDDLIRSSGTGKMRGMDNPQYVTELLVPLRELPPREELEKHDRNQLDLFGDECEGMCGV